MKCGHEAWEESASSRKCADCGQWLEPIVKPAADFQVGDRVSVEGVVRAVDACDGWFCVDPTGVGVRTYEIWHGDLTLIERPRRKLRVGSVWECADMRYTAVTKQHLSWVDHQGTPRITERSRLSFDSDPQYWREVPVEELEAEANA